MVGKDGTFKQARSLSERTGHTMSQRINARSIAIVVAGNFDKEEPTPAQLATLKALIASLDDLYHFDRIMPHKEASATACPGGKLEKALQGVWREADLGEPYSISRYYSPMPGQPRYFHGSLKEDTRINCGLYSDRQKAEFRAAGRAVSDDGMLDDGTYGDCSTTANGYKLKPEDAYKVAACPPDMDFGRKLDIDGIGTVTCVDRGGAIKNKRIDVWAGYGDDGLRLVYSRNGGLMSVRRLP